jgi:hypothetical protein
MPREESFVFEVSVVAPPASLRSKAPFYGALCVVSYWSLLLALRALVVESAVEGRAARTFSELLPDYRAIGLGLLAEVAFFFLSSAVVVTTLRLLREKAPARPILGAMALAHLPLLLWVGGTLFTSGLLNGGGAGDLVSLLQRGGSGGPKSTQLVAQALALLVAPELLARVAHVRRGRAMVACAVVGAAVTAVIIFSSRS